MQNEFQVDVRAFWASELLISYERRRSRTTASIRGNERRLRGDLSAA